MLDEKSIKERMQKSVDAVRRLKMHIEDKAFDMADPKRTVVLGRFDARQILGEFRYPGSDVPRVVEYYPALDLYKVKSWMGQAVPTYHTAAGDRVLEIPVGP